MEILKYTFDNPLIEKTIRDRSPGLSIYTPDESFIVLGFGSKSEIELNVDEVETDGIDVYRRRGGGCAVVLDPGNVIVSVTLPSSGFGRINEYFEGISKWLIDGLRMSGVDRVYREGNSDLVIENRKIGGACMQRKRDFVFYSASILVNPQIELMEKYLKHPPREPEYRKRRHHEDFVGSLSDFSSIPEAKALVDKLKENLDLDKLDMAVRMVHNG